MLEVSSYLLGFEFFLPAKEHSRVFINLTDLTFKTELPEHLFKVMRSQNCRYRTVTQIHITHNPNPSSPVLLKLLGFETSGDSLNVPACEKKLVF